MLYLLTGNIGCGKTTWLKDLLSSARSKGITVNGIITPAVFENGEKTGIDCMLLPDCRTIPFGKRFDLINGKDDTFDAKIQQRWIFNNSAMKEINAHLAHITADHPSEKLFMVDEIGSLECKKGQGFTEALRILEKGHYNDAIVVIRPTLLDAAQKRFTSGAGGESYVQIIEPGFVYLFG
jgi:nucleoside-triphosphatase THEP1